MLDGEVELLEIFSVQHFLYLLEVDSDRCMQVALNLLEMIFGDDPDQTNMMIHKGSSGDGGSDCLATLVDLQQDHLQ